MEETRPRLNFVSDRGVEGSSVSKQVDSVLGNMSNTCVSFGFSEEGEYLEDLRGDEEVRTEREGSYVVEDGKILSLG